MHILAAILLISASGSASATVESPVSIAATVFQIGKGAIGDVGFDGGIGKATSGILGGHDLAVSIDGRHAKGIADYAYAIARIIGYITDFQHAGSVEISNYGRVSRLQARRLYRIEDGRVTVTIDAWGSIGPKGELYHVRCRISAVETASGTTVIYGTATGYSRLGSRCSLVRRVVARRISEAMRNQLLGAVEEAGRKAYARGQAVGLTEIVECFLEGLR